MKKQTQSVAGGIELENIEIFAIGCSDNKCRTVFQVSTDECSIDKDVRASFRLEEKGSRITMIISTETNMYRILSRITQDAISIEERKIIVPIMKIK